MENHYSKENKGIKSAIKKGLVALTLGASLLSTGCATQTKYADCSGKRTLLQKPSEETTGEHLSNYFDETVRPQLFHQILYLIPSSL